MGGKLTMLGAMKKAAGGGGPSSSDKKKTAPSSSSSSRGNPPSSPPHPHPHGHPLVSTSFNQGQGGGYGGDGISGNSSPSWTTTPPHRSQVGGGGAISGNLFHNTVPRTSSDFHGVGDSQPVSTATKRLFNVLRQCPEAQTVSTDFLVSFLERSGLVRGDPRLASFFASIDDLGASVYNVDLEIHQFNFCIRDCRALVAKALHGGFVMPTFKKVFADKIEQMFEEIKSEDDPGHNATYIPQLAKVDPELFAVSVTTIDGQHCSFGDANAIFCLQSCTKVLTYIMAQEQMEEGFVHKHVGTEASGRPFNEICLKERPVEGDPDHMIPHNPMINAGAIMCTSMVYPGLSVRERMDRVVTLWRQMSGPAGAEKIICDEDTYQSENMTADRNRCLAFMMKNKNSFPHEFFEYTRNVALEDTLELYFRTCSLVSTTKLTSVMAATLANGGVNPLTGKRVVSALSVRRALSIMFSCGMYDYSGQWSYDIGVPAKSGVGGCVFLVIPNLCGIAAYSPRLDGCHNSVKALKLAGRLEKFFQFHTFEVFSGVGHEKVNPKEYRNESRYHFEAQVMYSAQEGDLNELSAVYQADPEIWITDYDHRTPLHVAVAENHPNVVKFLVDHCPEDRREWLSTPDRWGATPIDEAEEDSDCAFILKGLNLERTRPAKEKSDNDDLTDALGEDEDGHLVSSDAPRLLWAAKEGFLDEMVKMSANRIGMDIMDYDKRTPLHLAACENKLNVVKYVAAQLERNALFDALRRSDRFGNTPRMDAQRCNNQEIYAYLSKLQKLERSVSVIQEQAMRVNDGVSSVETGFRRRSIVQGMAAKKGEQRYMLDD